MMLSKDDAMICAKVFEDYFGNFNRIDEYESTKTSIIG